MRSSNRLVHNARDNRRGAVLVFAAAFAIVIAGLAAALLSMNLRTEKVRVQGNSAKRSFYAAEAGLSDAFVRLNNGLIEIEDEDEPVFLGTPAAPMTIGSMSYWVEINQLGTRSFSLASTGMQNGVQERLELTVATEPTGFFQYAAFGAEGVRLDSNSFIDSYDSTLGDYASQVTGGRTYALQNGDVGSNRDIVLGSNTEIHGDATPGPGHIVDDSRPGTYISGSTDPADELVPMPPIDVPALPSVGSLVSTSDLVLGPGEVHYDSLLMDGGATLTIRGPATIVLDAFGMKSGCELVFDTEDGPIDVYGTGDFVLDSNTDMITDSESATNLTILLSGNNMRGGKRNRIQLSSNADFIGAIYAPDIFYRLNSNFRVYGSIMCGALDLSSNGEIHFDEALLYEDDGDTPTYEPMLWRVLPHE